MSNYEIHFTQGVEGPHLSIWRLDDNGEAKSGYRFVGPKAWGGGQTMHRWKISGQDLIEALAQEVVELRPRVPVHDTKGEA